MRDYAELKQKYFDEQKYLNQPVTLIFEGDVLEKQVKKSDELLIKSNVKNSILKELLNRIEEKYGCLLTNVGCTTENGSWLSVKAIAALINELDKELRE